MITTTTTTEAAIFLQSENDIVKKKNRTLVGNAFFSPVIGQLMLFHFYLAVCFFFHTLLLL